MPGSIDRSAAPGVVELADLDDEIIATLAELVRVPSVTGREDLIIETLVDWAQRHGFVSRIEYCEPELHERFPALAHEQRLDKRANVLVTLKSRNATAHPIVLNGHIDVVEAGEGWTTPAFEPVIADGRMFGRGTVDMKGGVAAAMGAVRLLQEANVDLPFDVRIEFVMAEESGGLGTLTRIARRDPVAAVINLEPTEARIAAAAGGCLMVRVEVEGIAAHTSAPYRGVSALDKLIPIRAALIAFFDERRAAMHAPLFHELQDPLPGVVSVLRAGEWSATIPDFGLLEARVGVMPGESIEESIAALRARIDAVADADEWLRTHRPRVSMMHEGFPSWETSVDHPMVLALRHGATRAGASDVLTAVTYGNDGSHYAGDGVPTVILGPGNIDLAHKPDESVVLDEVISVARTIAHGMIVLGATLRERST